MEGGGFYSGGVGVGGGGSFYWEGFGAASDEYLMGLTFNTLVFLGWLVSSGVSRGDLKCWARTGVNSRNKEEEKGARTSITTACKIQREGR